VVIVETAHGLELGHVTEPPHEAAPGEITEPLKPILRKATDDDLAQEERNRRREREAFDIAHQKIEKHGLQMKLVDVEFAFSGDRIVFYFTSESRVDFRALVRDLARQFHARIELHQIGVRDQAKMIGGIGPCGRPLCCATFLGSFQPVAIRMAKEQGLSLNPLKISGVCGRLMCCLSYEYPHYRAMRAKMPRAGTIVQTPRGEGKVIDLNIPKESVLVILADGGQAEFPLAELAPVGGAKNGAEAAPERGECDHSCPACPHNEGNAPIDTEAGPV
jgi:cell fate regulator YaaT (PSP1 superfamily)